MHLINQLWYSLKRTISLEPKSLSFGRGVYPKLNVVSDEQYSTIGEIFTKTSNHYKFEFYNGLYVPDNLQMYCVKGYCSVDV